MNLRKTLAENKIILALLLASTLFFIYQHTSGISWDFAVYVLNAKYLFGSGHYFEWERPPLTPTTLFALSFFGYKIAEYIYIIFVSTLFAIACIKISKTAGFDKNIFYALMLSPYLLNYSFLAGTELLSLSLLILAITSIKEQKSGVYFGLSLLTRYMNIPYLLLLTVKKNVREILIVLAIIFLVFAPWMLYNQVEKNHPLYSVASHMILNLQGKTPGHYGRGILESLTITTWLLVGLAIAGFIRKYRMGFGEFDYIISGFAGITILVYLNLTFTDVRFLYNLSLPAGYFALYSIEKIMDGRSDSKKKMILTAIILLNLTTATTHGFVQLSIPNGLYESIEDLDGDCLVMSNAFTYLNYAGIQAISYPPTKEDVDWAIQNGARIILYHSQGIEKPDYMYDKKYMEFQPKITKTSNYIILGRKHVCKQANRLDYAYIEHQNITLCPILPIKC